MVEEQTSFLIELVKGGSFETVWDLFSDDAMTEPADLTGKSPRILLKYGNNQTLEWTIGGGQLSIIAPATNGKLRIALTASAIQALTFKIANGFLFLDGEDELLCEGVIKVK